MEAYSLPNPSRTGFYVCFVFYLCALVAVSVYSFMVARRQAAKGSSEISGHFQGNRSFGYVVMFLTLTASALSGYTVVGVPNESAGSAFMSTRWLVGALFGGLQFSIFAPRLRRLCVARHYMSPMDLISDRFNSVALKVVTAICLCIPQLIYIAVQLFTLNSTLEVVSGGEMNGKTVMWFLAVLIIICEWLGGLRGVIFTDCLQGAMMISGSLAISMILMQNYGGLSDLVGGNCPNYDPETNTGCLANTKWYLTLHPTSVGQSDLVEKAGLTSDDPQYAAANAIDNNPGFRHSALNMMSFFILFMSFGLNPHLVQRFGAVNKDSNLKKSIIMTFFCPFVITMPAMFMGIVKSAIYPKVKIDGVCDDVAGPGCNVYGVMLTDLMNKGGFSSFVAVISACSSIAAIMSTADSCVMGATNILSLDVVQGVLLPNLSDRNTLYISKGISAVYVLGAAWWSTTDMWTTQRGFYGKMLNIQNGFIWQCVPAFLSAMYLPDAWTSAYSILSGMLSGVFLVFLLEDQVQRGADLILGSGLYGVMLNVVIVAIVQKLMITNNILTPDDERTTKDAILPDKRRQYGPKGLTLATTNTIMCGTTEPILHKVGATLLALTFISGVVSVPWYSDSYSQAKEALAFSQYPMKADGTCYTDYPDRMDFGAGGGNSTEGVCYPAPDLGFVMGIPGWAFTAFAGFLIGTAMLLITQLMFWRTSTEESDPEEDDHEPLNDLQDNETSDIMLTPYADNKHQDKTLLDNVGHEL